MLLFWVLAGISTLVVTVVLALPLLRRHPPAMAQAGDGERERLDVFRDRRREIDRELASGRLDAREAAIAQQDLLRQLATDLPEARLAAPAPAHGDARMLPGIAALVLATLVPALALVTYRQVGAPTFLEPRPVGETVRMRLPPGHPPTLSTSSTAPTRPAPIAPTARGEIAALVAGIERRVREAPEDGEAWALLGAVLKAQGRQQEAQRAFDQAIARGNADARLLAEATGQPGPQPVASVVAGTVVVDPKLAELAERGGTLFVIAREADGPPIPIAVRREPGARLPMSFELDDTSAMTPSRLLSSAGTLVLEARLSRSGTANRQAGDLYGQLAAVEPGRTGLTIVMNRVVDASEVAGNAR